MDQEDKGYLFNLLPALYRIRDVEQDRQLEALFDVIEKIYKEIEIDIDRLYDNWFIETCDAWVVPYIGDLLNAKRLNSISMEKFSPRAYVANTIAYRRRKGTAFVLEQLARDVTGWPARAVEYFMRLSTTQNMNHVRPGNKTTVNFHDGESLEHLNGPFESATHTINVGGLVNDAGRYHIKNVGLFLWRLQDYRMVNCTACAVSAPPDGRFWFNPLGFDTPLFHHPDTEKEIDHLATASNVPGRLGKYGPAQETENCRLQVIHEKDKPKLRYFANDPVLNVYKRVNNGQQLYEAYPPEEILICDLGDLPEPLPGWKRPPDTKVYWIVDKDAGEQYKWIKKATKITVGIDPLRGRLAFSKGAKVPQEVFVTFSYGFPANIGGGPYNRADSFYKGNVDWLMVVYGAVPMEDNPFVCTTLKDAIDKWNEKNRNTNGITGMIIIADNLSYTDELPEIEIQGDNKMYLVAASLSRDGFPKVPQETDEEKKKEEIKQTIIKTINGLEPVATRPHLKCDLKIKASGEGDTDLYLNGLLIEGKLIVKPGNLKQLQIAHCTLVPYMGGMQVEPGDGGDNADRNEYLQIEFDHCISGRIRLTEYVPDLSITSSIIDNGNAVREHDEDERADVYAKGANTTIECCTIFASIECKKLDASNCIFTDHVQVEMKQSGCVRCSYLPPDSETPRRFRCQPDLALKIMTNGVHKDTILRQLLPLFTSIAYGRPGYAQASTAEAQEIMTGAEDGSEMGAFRCIQQHSRETNLDISLDEYLRFGLQTGRFYVT